MFRIHANACLVITLLAVGKAIAAEPPKDRPNGFARDPQVQALADIGHGKIRFLVLRDQILRLPPGISKSDPYFGFIPVEFVPGRSADPDGLFWSGYAFRYNDVVVRHLLDTRSGR
jgi:hypothetical protein